MEREMIGKRITLIRMEDPYTNLKEGDEGTVTSVDGLGQITVKWDNGTVIDIIPELDEFEINEVKKSQFRFIKSFQKFNHR